MLDAISAPVPPDIPQTLAKSRVNIPIAMMTPAQNGDSGLI